MSLYEHIPHPWHEQRGQHGPVRTEDHRGKGLNARIGLRITVLVGTMTCAYLFGAIALLSLPSAVSTRNLTVIIAWLSSSFIQLVLLPVIIVGQNAQAGAADGRAEQTYRDAESILHECLELQKHLMAQDEILTQLITATRKDAT